MHNGGFQQSILLSLNRFENPLSKPFRKGRFVECPGGNRLHRPHCIGRIKLNTKSVISQKETGNDPAGSLVAIGERMISDDPIRI